MTDEKPPLKKSEKLILRTPTTTNETEEAVTYMMNLCHEFIEHSAVWLSGKKVAGAKARKVMYNINANASTVNKAMIKREKESWK